MYEGILSAKGDAQNIKNHSYVLLIKKFCTLIGSYHGCESGSSNKKKYITYEELSLVVKDIKDCLKVRNNEDWANLL